MRTTAKNAVHGEHIVPSEPGDDVGRLYVGFVNVYFVGAQWKRWILVDTGLPHTSALVAQRAAQRYGVDRPPEAIILTHGHFDHAGNALALARKWDVPIYVHPLELPYLTGQSDYPPQDPTVGGALGLMSRAFPHSSMDLRPYVRALPDDGSVPGAPDWRWLFTPGHTAGHISLFRDRDGFLIAGDAFATVQQDSALSVLNLRTEFSVPPAPLTTDWGAARASVERLAALRPFAIAAGHGRPVRRSGVADDLAQFADQFTPPVGGRYSLTPATTDVHGVVRVPPAVRDTLPRNLMLSALVAGGVYLAVRQYRHQRDQARRDLSQRDRSWRSA